MYQFVDSSAVVVGNSGKFGLNQNALLKVFKFEPNGGKDGAALECAVVTIEANGKEYTRKYFPVSRAFDKDNNEITDPKNEFFIKDVNFLSATLVDLAKAVAGEDNVKVALSGLTATSTFKDFMTRLEQAAAPFINSGDNIIDVFLAYQWTISGENTRTFLELPKFNLIKHGKWVTKALGNKFELVEGDSIRYKTEEGIPHPFVRSAWFKESNYSNPQGVSETPSTPPAGGGTSNGGW